MFYQTRVSQWTKHIITLVLSILILPTWKYFILSINQGSHLVEFTNGWFDGELPNLQIEFTLLVGSCIAYFGFIVCILVKSHNLLPYIILVKVSTTIIIRHPLSPTIEGPIVGIEYYIRNMIKEQKYYRVL